MIAKLKLSAREKGALRKSVRVAVFAFLTWLTLRHTPAVAATLHGIAIGPSFNEAVEVGVVPRKKGVIAGNYILGRESYGIGQGFKQFETRGDYYDFYLEFVNLGPKAVRAKWKVERQYDVAVGWVLFGEIDLSLARDERYALRLKAADSHVVPANVSAWRITSVDYPALIGEGKADVVVCVSLTDHSSLTSDIVNQHYAKMTTSLPCTTVH